MKKNPKKDLGDALSELMIKYQRNLGICPLVIHYFDVDKLLLEPEKIPESIAFLIGELNKIEEERCSLLREIGIDPEPLLCEIHQNKNYLVELASRISLYLQLQSKDKDPAYR
ncbi:MAG: hypothetical protein GXO63_01040 [Candidatus Micrarchaeota archaeon]|nr:hypothetical protein [Candidatus Micrarchaeota archaeon]